MEPRENPDRDLTADLEEAKAQYDAAINTDKPVLNEYGDLIQPE